MSSTTLEPPVRPDPVWSVTPVRRLGFEVDALDLFCGAGGSSQGLHAAGVTVRAAANHNRNAIETHAANFRDTDHWCADLLDRESPDYVDVTQLPRARFLWASPSCRHHSRANAQKIYEQGRQLAFDGLDDDDFDEEAYANSERSRVSMSCVLRYAAHHEPDLIIVENVVEVAKWGPDQDGTTFAWWLRELQLLGYHVQDCWLNSMFFGVPQSRDRVYFVCSRVGNPIPDVDYRPPATCTSDTCQGRRVEAVQTWKRRTRAWPLPRWGRYDQQYTYTCPHCRTRVHPDAPPVQDVIDWSLPCPTIGERVRPLANATRRRVLDGMRRYGFIPVLTVGAGNGFESAPGTRSRPLTQPAATQSTTATQALATPPAILFQPAHGGRFTPLDQAHPTVCASDDRQALVIPLRNNGIATPVDQPTSTVCAGGNHHALLMRNNTARGRDQGQMVTPVYEPARTFTTTGHQSLLMPYYSNATSSPVYEPCRTVTTTDRFSLVAAAGLAGMTDDEIIDGCGLRMLTGQPEVQRIMAFHPEYILLGNKKQVMAGLGNAVTPPVPTWLTERAVATLRGVAA